MATQRKKPYNVIREEDLTNGRNHLVKEVIREGDGPSPAFDGTAQVYVHYTGKLQDGKVFDSSVQRNTPFDFTLGAGSVIQGWELGVKSMRKGEKCVLTIAPHLAYGSRAVGPIPADSTLIFEIELLDIKERKASPALAQFLTSLIPLVLIVCAYLYLTHSKSAPKP